MGQGSSQPERRGEGSGQSRRRPTARLPSQPELIGDGQLRPLSPVRPSPQPEMIEAGQSTGRPVGRPRGANARPRPRSIYRFSQLLRNHSGTSNPNDEEGQQGSSSGSDEHADSSRTGRMVERTRSTFRHMLGRGESSRDVRHPRIGPPFWPRQGEPFIPQRASYHGPAPPPHAGAEELRSSRRLPDTWPIHDELSAIDFQPITPVATQQPVRLSGLRSERSGIARRLTSFRRRRSAQPEIRRLDGNDDQAIMLSRLLSVAAAATAATLMGDDNNALGGARSLADGTSVGEYGGGGEDGSFDGFLRSLQNGRIASALRAGTDPEAGPSDAAGPPAPLNFFRMFRFGTSNAPSAAANAPANGSEGRNSEGDSRMVPIIIVGIRSISPNTAAASDDSEHPLPPFMDALGGFPSPVPAHALGQHAHDSIDSILRPPQNGTSFRHRRRASMGAFGMSRNRLSDRMDDQRDHRSPDRRRERPWSMASANSAFEPRPPHVTPASASPELSRISSRQTTPNESRRASIIANSMRELTEDSRRNSLLRRSTGPSPLSSHTEESLSLHSTHSGTNLLSPPSPDTAASTSAAAGSAADHLNLHNSTTTTHRRSDANPNVHYPRFASGHPRRNGVVEPDNLPPLSRASTSNATDDAASGTNTTNDHSSDREGGGGGRNSAEATDSRSWIIYVLGGSYPEDHPILTTPSLFTENPTYEDMMLLSALLGPAKAPVASEEDVQSAGGLYTTEIVSGSASASFSEVGDAAKTAQLVAVATDESPRATALGTSSGVVNGNAEERVYLELGQRCLVCLCEFEPAESVRKLVKCEHLFHRECIDQWLTQGRNSCPLCRGLGVNETEKAGVDPAASSASASASGSGSGSGSATTAGAARSAGNNAETTASVRNSAVSSDFEDWHVLPA